MSSAAEMNRSNLADAVSANGSEVSVLVVDDNAAKRLALRSVLSPLGLEIIEADSGLSALRCVMARDFAVIILDVRMPIMDGFETAALIRKRHQSEMTPIIFITSFGSDEINRTDLYAEGAVDFMFAPVPPRELQAKVSAFARLFSKSELLADHAREVQSSIDELRVQNVELYAETRIDSLTGLGNRRALEDDLAQLDARVSRYAHSYCVAVLDVDDFKAYNDTYGHQAGDQVLETFAGRIKGQARSGDGLYRYGGDEFVCVFAEQSLSTGAQALQRLQIDIERLVIPHERSPLQLLSFSAGLAMLNQARNTSAVDVLKDADDALYRAKQLGRNRIEYVVAD